MIKTDQQQWRLPNVQQSASSDYSNGAIEFIERTPRSQRAEIGLSTLQPLTRPLLYT